MLPEEATLDVSAYVPAHHWAFSRDKKGMATELKGRQAGGALGVLVSLNMPRKEHYALRDLAPWQTARFKGLTSHLLGCFLYSSRRRIRSAREHQRVTP